MSIVSYSLKEHPWFYIYDQYNCYVDDCYNVSLSYVTEKCWINHFRPKPNILVWAKNQITKDGSWVEQSEENNEVVRYHGMLKGHQVHLLFHSFYHSLTHISCHFGEWKKLHPNFLAISEVTAWLNMHFIHEFSNLKHKQMYKPSQFHFYNFLV